MALAVLPAENVAITTNFAAFGHRLANARATSHLWFKYAKNLVEVAGAVGIRTAALSTYLPHVLLAAMLLLVSVVPLAGTQLGCLLVQST